MHRDTTPPERIFVALTGADIERLPLLEMMEASAFRKAWKTAAWQMAVLTTIAAFGIYETTQDDPMVALPFLGISLLGFFIVSRRVWRQRPQKSHRIRFYEQMGRAYLLEKMMRGELPLELTHKERINAGVFLECRMAGSFGPLRASEYRILERFLAHRPR